MKFIIPKGQPFEAYLIIKSENSPTGEPLDPSAVGTFTISKAYEDMCQIVTIPLTVVNAANGKVKLSMTAQETDLLPYEIQFKEDGSKPLQTCKAMIKMPILSGEIITAYLYSVYVYNAGEACTQ